MSLPAAPAVSPGAPGRAGAPAHPMNPTPLIRGSTALIAHLGYPTQAFKAPMIYNPYFAHAGIDAVVVPMGARADDFPAVLKAVFSLSNIGGALITMPHKVTVCALVDELSPTAAIAGSANAVRRDPASGRLQADMFDGEGFVRGVLRKGKTLAGSHALVVGAGGVGCAIAASLAKAGVAQLSLYDVNPDSAEALAQRLAQHYPQLQLRCGSADPQGHDLVVNATPLGMNPGDALPVDMDRLQPGCFVGEVVMKTEMTAFLQAAVERGHPVQVGSDMLFEMIPAYLEYFGYPSATPQQLRDLAQLRY